MIVRVTTKQQPRKKFINRKYSNYREILQDRRYNFFHQLKFNLDLSIVLQERDLPEFQPSSAILPDSLFAENVDISYSVLNQILRLDRNSPEFRAITQASSFVEL